MKDNRKSFLVIGLGRFGSSLACSLEEAGQEVLGVDTNSTKVQLIVNRLTHVVILDATNEVALSSLGVGNFDAAIVASGSNFESSILITMLLKRLGARYIVAKALTEQQAYVLSQVGADRVVQPEREAGLHLANKLISPNLLDYFILEPDLRVAEVLAPDWMSGNTISNLDIRHNYKVTILLIKNGNRLLISPNSKDIINAGDTLIVFGHEEDIRRLRE